MAPQSIFDFGCREWLRLATALALLTLPAATTHAQETQLPQQVYEELQDTFFMNESMELLENPRSRVEMHSYLTESGEFLFLLAQPGGDVTIDEFRPMASDAIDALTLTMDMPGETLRMVHMMLSRDADPLATRLIEGALQSVDQGGPLETTLYLLGIHEIDGAMYQVLLRQETSSTGDPRYWIHFF